MKFKSLTLSIIALCLSLILSGCQTGDAVVPEDSATDNPTGTTAENDKIESIKINFADPVAKGSFANSQVQYFADKVSELSGGKMVIDVFADSLLGTENAMATNIQSGGLQMGAFSSTFVSMVPKAGLFDLPYIISDRSQLQTLLDEGILDDIFTQAEDINIKVLSFAENGFRHISNKIRPINVPDDLKNIVIRTPGSELRVKTFEALGAQAVSLAWSEVYSALESGVCDGQENPLAQITSAQLYDVQKYLSLSSHIYSPIYMCINLDLYNSLSDAQKAVLEEAGDLTTKYAWEAGAQSDEEKLQICIDKGMEINNVDTNSFREILLPLWDEFADIAGGAEFVNKVKAALGY